MKTRFTALLFLLFLTVYFGFDNRVYAQNNPSEDENLNTIINENIEESTNYFVLQTKKDLQNYFKGKFQFSLNNYFNPAEFVKVSKSNIMGFIKPVQNEISKFLFFL